MRPLLSIVIPTKDRYEYLKGCIESLLLLKEKFKNELEIVIQDNSLSNGAFKEYLNLYEDKFVYNHNTVPVSVIENCDDAIKNSTGEYVCFIGDDDSVTTTILDVAYWMREHNLDACLGNIVRFNWPDMVGSYFKLHSLTIPPKPGINKIIEPTIQVKKVLRNGGSSLFLLPKVYHGIVSRNSLDIIFKKTRTFFPGPSPDMANAIALGLIVKKYAVIDMPFIISGFSYKSTGGQGARHAHVGKLEDMPHLPKDTVASWNSLNPRIWTAPTIWAESAIKSLEKMDRCDLLSNFNYTSLYAALLVNNVSLKHYAFQFVKSSTIVPFIWQCFRFISQRASYMLRGIVENKLKISNRYIKDDVKNLILAQEIVSEYIRDNSIELPSLR